MLDKKNLGKNWLESLQQESWHLELLVSGFSIFLLTQGISHLIDTGSYISFHFGSGLAPEVLRLFVLILAMGSILLTINLVVHVILRGVWIGAIGLRSVEGKTDLRNLNYNEFFVEKLESRVSTLDNMILRLDKLCSVIFAFTFMVVFMMLSLFIFCAILSFIIGSLMYFFPSLQENPVIPLLILLFCVFYGLIYLIDTLSLGFFKRFKWYYSIYIVMNTLTLSFIYQSIYYNIISRFPKNRIRSFMIPYLFLATLWPFFTLNYYTYIPDQETSNRLSYGMYEDELPEDEYIQTASIPSRIIKENYVPLFIRYNPKDNERIADFCNDYKPSKDSYFYSGIYIGPNGFSFTDASVVEENPEKLLECLTNFHRLYINDSLYESPKYYYFEHPRNEEQGITTMLSIQDLPPGEHTLHIKQRHKNKQDSIVENSLISIPFWKD